MEPPPICGPKDMGLVIYGLISDTESDTQTRYSDFAANKGMPITELSAELIALRWIAADYAVTQQYGESPERNAVLDPFLDCVHRAVEPDLVQFLTGRICQYAVALNQGGTSPSLSAGAAFARLLFQRRQASESDLYDAALIGYTEFEAIGNAVREGLRLVRF